jgi:hypothetical protein
MQNVQQQSLTACIFYFDVIHVWDAYLSDRRVLNRLKVFQRSVRAANFAVGCPWSTLITLYDNVWARINANEPAVEHIALKLATNVMRSAQSNGFREYFGACTKGLHTFDIIDKTLVGGSEPCDIRIQHIDTLSEPHMRAASLEKWLIKLKKVGRAPINTHCIWIGEEVADYRTLVEYARSQGLDYSVLCNTLDFNELPADDQSWPFPEHSKFTAIGI